MLRNKMICSLVSMTLAIIMVVLPVATPISAVDLVSATKQTKIDPLLREKMAEASADEKIPVSVWYNDIDHAQVKSEVLNATNLSIDELDLNMEMPSVSLINDYKNNNIGSSIELINYFESTKEIRALEKRNTDEYICAERNISKQMYNKASKEIISGSILKNNNVTFVSNYAPMMMAELTKSDIETLSKDYRIEGVYLIREQELKELELEISKEAINHSDVVDLLGLTGEGVTVGMIEANGHPDTVDTELSDTNIVTLGTQNVTSVHATNVASIIAGKTKGTAPNVDLVSVFVSSTEHPNSFNRQVELFTQIENMLSYGVKIINCSTGSLRYDGYDMYDANERWFDYLVSFHHITFVVAAGNEGEGLERITYFAMGYNSITVGAYDGKRTVSTVDDQMSSYSSFENTGEETSADGIEKPDVILPGNLYYKEDGTCVDGTSYATPLLVGSIALLFELKPSLAVYPQAIKAITLASCHRKVQSSIADEPVETLQQGITERQGAGVPDVWTMACIVSQGAYGVGVLENTATSDSRHFVMPNYGANNMNVSITWLRDVMSVNMAATTVGEYANLDLSIYGGNGTTPIKTSEKALSSTEMTYFPLSNNSNYEIRIEKPITESDVRYGFAYSTDSPYITSTSQNGLYYIKNLQTNQYLTIDANTKQIKMTDYVGTAQQQWIINSFKVSSAFNTIEGTLNKGGAINTTDSLAILGNNTMNFSRQSWENNTNTGNNGAHIIYTYVGSQWMALSCNGNNAIITTDRTITDNKYWVLEEIHYRLGDCNMDGILNINDVTRIEYYLEDSISLTNAEKFLADVDCDGQISENDQARIRMILAGLELY